MLQLSLEVLRLLEDASNFKLGCRKREHTGPAAAKGE